MKIINITCVFLASCTVSSANLKPSSCAELLLIGHIKSELYTIFPRALFKPIPFQVYCDMKTDGGGWTVFQKRDDILPRENFYRNWQDYKSGFGNLEKEFWLGNDHLFVLTNQDEVTMRVDLEDFEYNQRWAEFKQFRIGNEKNYYQMSVSGYNGNAGDSMMAHHNNANFSTYDQRDTDSSKLYKGGWWYNKGFKANLNGLYLHGVIENYTGIAWSTWRGGKYSLKKVEMKVRPTNFLLHNYSE